MCIRLPCGYSHQTLSTVIAYLEIVFSVLGITVWIILAPLLQMSSDLLQHDPEAYQGNITHTEEYHEVDLFPQIPHILLAILITWTFVHCLASLIFAIILLHGAQQRNMKKVRLWYFASIFGYVSWFPLMIVWILHSVEPVDIIFGTLIWNIYGCLSLSIVNSLIQELKLENIAHRPGYKQNHRNHHNHLLLPFDKV